MATHNAVVTVAPRAPLQIIQVPTIKPTGRRVRVRVLWTASTPLDLHQADGGLLVKHPHILGDSIAGEVVEVGPSVRNLAVGDKVFGFAFEEQKDRGHQEFATVEETALSKLPSGFTLQEAVTLPNNVVTVFHAITTDLKLPLPWPRPQDAPAEANTPILIWGGSSSCGQYALQVLSLWGYKNLIATASSRHHDFLRTLGAKHVFDYKDPDVVKQILDVGESQAPAIPLILDCIGSKNGSLAAEAKIAQKGSIVAILTPVILKDATDEEPPVYSMDVQPHAPWADGVEVRGVRTHFYKDNEFFREHLQPTIIPELLATGAIKPNKQKIIEGKTLLERAENARLALRRKEASGERLVWRINEA